jgi:hypothetical protein
MSDGEEHYALDEVYQDFGDTDDVDVDNPGWEDAIGRDDDSDKENVPPVFEEDDEDEEGNTKENVPMTKGKGKIMDGTEDDDTRKSYLGRSMIDNDGNVWVPVSGVMRRLSMWHLNWDKNNKDPVHWPGEPTCEDGSYICWYDTYPFKGTVWPLAQEFSSRFQQWYMYEGHFCSPHCALAYLNWEQGTFGSHKQSIVHSNTRQFWKEFYEYRNRHIPVAPPKYWLQRWQPMAGMSIEEFRAISSDKDGELYSTTIMKKPMVSIIQLVEVIKFKKESQAQTKARQQREDSRSKKRKIQAINNGTVVPSRRSFHKSSSSALNSTESSLMSLLKGKKK